jgi:hypothetical protein
MRFFTLLALCFAVVFSIGCFKIVPTVSSDEVKAVQENLDPIFEEYREYVENDTELDGMSKDIRLSSPDSIEELLQQMYENAKQAEEDGYINEEESE